VPLLFEDFSLDVRRRELRRGADLLTLEPKVFDLLAFLIENRERVVTRDELIAHVWNGRIVSESALATCINASRAALNDSGDKQRLIKTLQRKGIRFLGEVREEEPAPYGTAQAQAQTAAPPLELPDRPSMAVLPFQNLSSDPEQEYFADGIVEDIIAGLSRISWLFVIARNSSFVYKGRAVDIKQVGRELGVRYVLEGSVRKSGDRIRIAAQLVEAQSGSHLWADRYDRSYSDIFDLQDEIAMSVIGAIEPNLRKLEIERVKRKRPENLGAYDLVLRALPHTYSHRAEDADIAIPQLLKALELEPSYPAAHASLAWCYHFLFRLGLRDQDRAKAIEHAHAGLAGAADDATTLGIAGFVISMDERDYATGLDLFDRALSLSNSNIFALSCSALILSFMGRFDDAMERAQRALRLSPFDSLNYLSYNALVVSHLCSGRYQQAHEAGRQSVQLNPRFSVCHAFLAAALAGQDRIDEARAQAQRVLTLEPTFTISRFLAVAGFETNVFQRLSDAWMAAGLPMR
jgi:TolB-like protein/Tfp pilus assembly protein PilF